jgi:D-alanyl-lipoteichoic acid acyltransferase DltB (MBOAT superfamily)
MLFNSLEFAIFLPIVVALYFLLPQRLRTPLLLLSSCFFYMAFIPAYILVLLVLILIDYWSGILLECMVGSLRPLLLLASILSTCSALFVFKYFNFFTGTFAGLADLAGWHIRNTMLNIILPIGLSFHTFQSLSYVIEVYGGRQRAERGFITYATYVMFFPQLVAGPIERPQNLLHQFDEAHSFDYDRVVSGLKRIAWGVFKKVVVADRLALYVNDVYRSPRDHGGLQLTLATVFFAYQIYCDFSGYSDIAIGSARVLGFTLMENFRTPYYSRSISEFWRRWHISLSTWFRDYLYRPLGGNRVCRQRHMFNLMVTFAVSGLWHGARWTYVVWGLLNGVYLVIGVATKPIRNWVGDALGLHEDHPFRQMIAVICTFTLVCIGWVVFRADNLGDAAYILSHFWKQWDIAQIRTEQFLLRQLPVALLAIVLLECIQWMQPRFSLSNLLTQRSIVLRWPVYACFVLGVVLFGVYRSNQFIYFQF